MKIEKRYVGKCSTFTNFIWKDKICSQSTTAFILSIYRFWKWEFRHAKIIGNTDKDEQSKAVKDLQILVKTWLSGGPLPPLDDDGKIRNAQIKIIK